MSKTKREESVRFSVNIPKSLSDEIDIICASNFMSKNSWIVQAAKKVLALNRLDKLKELKNKMNNEVNEE